MKTGTRWRAVWTLALLAAAGCDEERVRLVTGAPGTPDAPEDLRGWYYAGAVELAWRLGAQWDGEAFRVYARRSTEARSRFIAEVTSCAAGECAYRDMNVRPGATYLYHVAAVSAQGAETATREVEVRVPQPVAPPAPAHVDAVALDDAVFVRWDNRPATEDDFSLYAVYLDQPDGSVLLGETDSPGFVDFLAENGTTYAYFVTSTDEDGHESDGSPAAAATPRPDYAGEIVHAHRDAAESSGFRFMTNDEDQAVTGGTDSARHFRVDARDGGLWIEPAPGVGAHSTPRATTALACGPGADADCVSWTEAPATGYEARPVRAEAGFTTMFRVPGDDGEVRFGAVRVQSLGVDQEGRAFVVFDWAFQTQAGNRSLDRRGGVGAA